VVLFEHEGICYIWVCTVQQLENVTHNWNFCWAAVSPLKSKAVHTSKWTETKQFRNSFKLFCFSFISSCGQPYSVYFCLASNHLSSQTLAFIAADNSLMSFPWRISVKFYLRDERRNERTDGSTDKETRPCPSVHSFVHLSLSVVSVMCVHPMWWTNRDS